MFGGPTLGATEHLAQLLAGDVAAAVGRERRVGRLLLQLLLRLVGRSLVQLGDLGGELSRLVSKGGVGLPGLRGRAQGGSVEDVRLLGLGHGLGGDPGRRLRRLPQLVARDAQLSALVASGPAQSSGQRFAVVRAGWFGWCRIRRGRRPLRRSRDSGGGNAAAETGAAAEAGTVAVARAVGGSISGTAGAGGVPYTVGVPEMAGSPDTAGWSATTGPPGAGGPEITAAPGITGGPVIIGGPEVIGRPGEAAA